MPNIKKYDWETPEEMKECRRKCDRENKFIKFWANTYNIKIGVKDIELVKKYKSEIKKILPILQFIKNMELVISEDNLNL